MHRIPPTSDSLTRDTTMSLQINLSSTELKQAYLSVLNAQADVDWTIFTYEKGTNDLKVQATGSGGLEELGEEFMDGRSVFFQKRFITRNLTLYRFYSIQYAFARVTDPNVCSLILSFKI